MTDDYYGILGVSQDASVEEIERAFREKAREHHPDQSDDPNAAKTFRRLKEAREFLTRLHGRLDGLYTGAGEPSVAASAEDRLTIDEAFPFSSYFPHQREILLEAADALFRDQKTSIVVIDAPTGIGKSGVNIALGRLADDAFYTTPQTKLRRQLAADPDLGSYHAVLRARHDYQCEHGNELVREQGEDRTVTCQTCPINLDGDRACRSFSNCTYWNAKERAMANSIATVTFAYLIVDSRLPTMVDTELGPIQVSFADRELLIVDEAHALEEQVAALHAGITISPFNVPWDLYTRFHDELRAAIGGRELSAVDLDYLLPDGGIDTLKNESGSALSWLYSAVVSEIEWLRETLRNPAEDADVDELSNQLDDLESLMWKLLYLDRQVARGRPWVLDIETIQYNKQDCYRTTLKPVYVDDFLQRFVWSRADKVVLSSATVPFRDSPDQWLTRIGLDPSAAHFIRKPMPFDASNRPIYTDTIIGRFSKGRDQKHWSEIEATLGRLAERHAGQKGLIHTASYARAERLQKSFADNALLHDGDSRVPDEYYINKWQDGDKDMLLTPAMMDGVDLPDEKCRWQVLVKVPYARPTDPRVEYLLEEEGDWNWYYEVAARQLVQSVGRAVRNPTDHAEYYVLDGCFMDVMNRSSAPAWFTEAIRERHELSE